MGVLPDGIYRQLALAGAADPWRRRQECRFRPVDPAGARTGGAAHPLSGSGVPERAPRLPALCGLAGELSGDGCLLSGAVAGEDGAVERVIAVLPLRQASACHLPLA